MNIELEKDAANSIASGGIVLGYFWNLPLKWLRILTVWRAAECFCWWWGQKQTNFASKNQFLHQS